MRELTGKKVFAITAMAFGVIISVNVALAVKAVSTFPGMEVDNSYVASQSFDADMAEQKALGWTLKASYDPAKQALALHFTNAAGAPVDPASVTALIGRPTEAREDQSPAFVWADGGFFAPVTLHPGKWMLHVEARARDGKLFRQRLNLIVAG